MCIFNRDIYYGFSIVIYMKLGAKGGGVSRQPKKQPKYALDIILLY